MKAWNASSAAACWLFGNLSITFAVLCPAALLTRFRPDLTGGLPEPECAIGDGEPRRHVEPAPLQVEQQIAPVLRALAGAIGEAESRRRLRSAAAFKKVDRDVLMVDLRRNGGGLNPEAK